MSGKRVLIVDDEAPMRFLLSKQLARAGFETTSAANGEAALAAAIEGAYDAVVLDVIMPGMDGFEVCRRLKGDDKTAAIPVFFLSASCSGEFRRRAFSVGAADFLAKPFQTEELPVYIQSNLQRAERPAGGPGQVISVIGASRPAGAAAFATRLAESAALQGPGPVMLIDLELPAGSIGARLQLSGGPNMRVLLQNTGDPVTAASIARVAQRYHGAMEVIPAPFSPSAISQAEPQPRRLEAVLDNLVERGYCVILHLGTRVDELTSTALRRSEAIWTAATSDDIGELEALLNEIMAAGIPRERISPATEEALERGLPVAVKAIRSRARQQSRPLETAAGQLVPAA